MLHPLRSLVLFLALVLMASCSKFEKLRKSTNNEEKYKAAIEYYRLKDFAKAGILFDETLPLLKGSTELEMASFYQAKCDFENEQYQTASFHFKTFAETFARSDFAEEAVYMSAYSLYRDAPDYFLDQTSSATASDALQSFINNYPTSKFAPDASKILTELRVKMETKAFEKAKLYYKTSAANIANYRAAVIAISNFQKDFPDSRYMEEMLSTKVNAQYFYALNSFENKKKERYEETVKFYLELVDKYPKSKYLKGLEKQYEFAQKEVERLNKEEKARKDAEEKARKEREQKKEEEKAGKIGGAPATTKN